MTKTAEKVRVNVFEYQGDRFQAIALLSKIKRMMEREYFELYKEEYLKAYSAAHFDYIRDKKGINTDNPIVKFMSNEADVEGFDYAYTQSFSNPVVEIDVYELNYNVCSFYIRNSSNNGFTAMIMKLLAAETNLHSEYVNENLTGFPGTLECQYGLRLSFDSSERESCLNQIESEISEISHLSLFSI